METFLWVSPPYYAALILSCDLSLATQKSNNNLTPCVNPMASWALGQLLGIAQRTVEAVLPEFKQRFSARKLIPTEVKSLGDYLLLKRIKADLSQPELAGQTGFTVRKIKMWEYDRAVPTPAQWQVLAGALSLEDSARLEAIKR